MKSRPENSSEETNSLWIKVAQLDDTCFIMSIYCFTALLVQPALEYHITNSQSRYITPTRLKSAHYSPHNNAPSSRKLLKMDVLTSETCWAVNWHNKPSVIKLVYLYSDIKMMHGPIRIRNKQSIDIWGWCHTPFQSKITQVRDDSDNIRFLFHFTVRGTHKTVCEIRDCKKKTQTSTEEKKWRSNFKQLSPMP